MVIQIQPFCTFIRETLQNLVDIIGDNLTYISYLCIQKSLVNFVQKFRFYRFWLTKRILEMADL